MKAVCKDCIRNNIYPIERYRKKSNEKHNRQMRSKPYWLETWELKRAELTRKGEINI